MALFTRRKQDGQELADDDAERLRGEARAKTIGEQLSEARERHGARIEDIGAALRIRPAFLKAIEEDQYASLPGPVYALGFVRTYADYLGLDGEMIAQRFKSKISGLEKRRDFALPMPLPERGVPGGAILLVALIVAACAYAVWLYRGSGERARPERVAAVPEQLMPLPPAPPPPLPATAAPSDTPPATPPAAAPDGTAPATSSVPTSLAATSSPSPGAATQADAPPARPAPAPAATAAAAPPVLALSAPVPPAAPATPAPSQSAATQPASASAAALSTAAIPGPAVPTLATSANIANTAPAASTTATAAATASAIPEVPAAAPSPNEPRVFGITNGPVRIVIKSTGDSWVQVRDANQTPIQTRTLRAGDSLRVPDLPGLTVRAGNAGALQISVDGKPVPPIGPPGKARSASLDPDRLISGTATSE